MRVNLDSSATIKRVALEPESDAPGDYLDEMTGQSALLSRDLIRVDLCRALMRLPRMTADRLGQALDDASGDLALEPTGADVVALAMRLQPEALRSPEPCIYRLPCCWTPTSW